MESPSFDTKDFINIIDIRTAEDLVDFLINKCAFSQLSYDDQIYVVKELSRPVPNLPSLTNTGQKNRAFNTSWYDKFDWLTGSTVTNKLYCWPCILFSNSGVDVWHKWGYCDLKNLSRALNSHSKSTDHIHSNCRLLIMRKQQQNVATMDVAREKEIEDFNGRVKENRAIIKSLLDVALHLCSQEYPDSLSGGNFKQLVTLLSKYDSNLRQFLEKDGDPKSFFSDTLDTIQNELNDSIASAMNETVEGEISESLFFSYQINEVSDYQLSIILRYIYRGQPVERFMGFYNVTQGWTAEHLYQFLQATFGKLDLQNKLVAQTYDGAAVSGELNSVQAKIKSVAPQAILTHSYAQEFDLVLTQACTSNQVVRVFFASLAGFSLYFAESTRRTQVLDEVCGGTTPWNFSSGAVLMVYNNKDKLLQVFEHIINNKEFDDASIRGAVGLRNFLEDNQSMFLLETFALICQQADVLYTVFQDTLMDVIVARNVIKRLLDKLLEFKTDEYFTQMFNKLIDIEQEPKRRKCYDNPILKLKQVYFEIFDTIINQIQVRFNDLDKLHILDLLNVSKFLMFRKSFPDDLFKKLIEQYNFFNSDYLKNELIVLYGNDLIGDCNTPLEMLNYFRENELYLCLPELYKLICLIVALPVTSCSTEEANSTLNRVKTYVKDTKGHTQSSNMALISLEKSLIKSRVNENEFLENIIDHFANLNQRRIPLTFINV